MSEHNCPFYGRHFVWWGFLRLNDMPLQPFNLLDSHGNQCALAFGRYAPCALEIEGKPVEWRDCPRVTALTPQPQEVAG